MEWGKKPNLAARARWNTRSMNTVYILILKLTLIKFKYFSQVWKGIYFHAHNMEVQGLPEHALSLVIQDKRY